MPWLKVSDRFATHPLLLRLRTVARADERTMNEVVGFVTRCSAQSACYLTDYFVDLPTAELFGGGRTELLLRQATAAGLLAPSGRGVARRWKIVEDEDLFHVRAREDVEWERQRDRDRRNPDLTMPVLARDGDQCRYCLVIVNWRDTRSGRGGTFDHRNPGEPATLDTYVVACRKCNSKRRDNPNADRDVPLSAPPVLPYFSPKSGSRERVEAFYGRPIEVANKRPGADTAAGATRDTAAVGATSDTATARPVTDTAASAAPSRDTAAVGATPAHPDHPPPWVEPTPVEPPWSEGGRPVGSGRVRDEPGRDGSGGADATARVRGRRGRRSEA